MGTVDIPTGGSCRRVVRQLNPRHVMKTELSVLAGTVKCPGCLVAWVWCHNLLRLTIVRRGGMDYGDVGIDVLVEHWSQCGNNRQTSQVQLAISMSKKSQEF